MRYNAGQVPGSQPQHSTAFRTATVLASVIAVCALAVDYGFRLPGYAQIATRTAQILVVGFFVLHSVLRLYWAGDRLGHLRAVWYEFVLILLLAASLVGISLSELPTKASYHILAVQIVIVLFLLIRLTELARLVSASRFRPAQIFVTSFVMLILLGTGLLMLPAATGENLLIRNATGEDQLPGNVLQQTDIGLTVQTEHGIEFHAHPKIAVEGKAPPANLSTALFTATSAVCVTGLIVQPTGGYWSPFGQTVILVLIQLGGLGIMTFGAVFALLLWQGLGLRQSAVMKDMMGPTMSIQVGRVLVFILASTLLIEAVGAWSLWGLWDDVGMTTGQRVFYSVFHAISAFCNAGFCLYGDSLERYKLSWQANGAFAGLIVVGGLGFMVIYNLSRISRCHLRRWWTRMRGHLPRPELDRRRLTLQSKLVLLTTAVLLVVGTGLVMLFESLPARRSTSRDSGAAATTAVDAAPDEAAGAAAGETPGAIRAETFAAAATTEVGEPAGEAARGASVVISQAAPAERLALSWFQSVTARTAGFNTSTTKELSHSSQFLTVLLMFIGASPGSTGGGIKTATLAIIMCGIWSLLRNRSGAQAFKRTIPQNILLRSLVIMTLGAAVVAVATMILSVTQAGFTFLDFLFEATSAFGTVGLSTGVTGSLNLLGRLLIIAMMFIGRVGPLTLFIALPLGVRKAQYEYPTETVAIG